MAKKHSRHRNASRVSQAASALPASQLSRYDAAFQKGSYSHALELAQGLVKRYPQVAKAHELQANALGRLECFADASSAMQRMLDLLEDPDPLHWLKLAQYQVLAGQASSALDHLERVIEAEPDNPMARVWLSRALHQFGDNRRALEVSDRALAQDPRQEEVLLWRARILDQLKRHDEALEALETLLNVNPSKQGVHNHIATLYVKESDYEKAEYHYRKELELNPGNSKVMANLFTASHYNPAYAAQALFEQALEWDERFAPQQVQPAETARIADRKLRVALLSGGFRMHPVGQMSLPAIKALPRSQFELVVYSTSQASDFLTDEFRAIADRWDIIEGLTDIHLERRIRDDAIDILIDMNGAGDGSRYEALVNKPAPLMIKWVGSLINTTGLRCFDYLLSDAIETPEGVDGRYTEKLIRLPDDYVCYHMPQHAPQGGALPALKNGYITFGCLNNPAKLSPPMLAEWAALMNELPDSRLLLRGVQFESPRFRGKVAATLAEHGIAEERILMEGPAQHTEFMATYQRIDIALDTWPYSGGLTTCEALMMGVPVVTRVGPTFAGRHSATHLVNAGLPELVTDSWEDFRKRARELASDLPNLAVIRASLRTILMDSPICDGPRFANHLITALRAIWQRHCEGKAPEALTFSKSGAAQFSDEDAPVRLALSPSSDGFDWQLESPIVAVDNGAALASRPDARELLGSGRVVMLSFDPARKIESVDHLAQYGEIQHFPYTALGDGQPATLYVSEVWEPTSLVPLNHDSELETHEIPTVALNSVEGLSSIDLLALDASHDSVSVLENASMALKDTLAIQACVAFQPTLKNQADFSRVQSLLERLGFRFYCFLNEKKRSRFPEGVVGEQRQASELQNADALFLPSHERMSEMNDTRSVKLAFLLHAVYGIKDMAYALLRDVDEERSKAFLIDEGLLEVSDKGRQLASQVLVGDALPRRKVFVVGFPKSGTSTIQKALEETGYASAHWKVKEGFVGELMYKGLNEKDDPWYYLGDYDAITQGDVCLPSQDLNHWPNLDFDVIDKIREKHPGCLFLLNYRDPKDTASSIARWGSFLGRLKSCGAPGLAFGEGDNIRDLQAWIIQHVEKVRSHFKGDDDFLEVDVSDSGAPKRIGKALGVELAWWGVANENKRTRNINVPDSPHMSSGEKILFRKSLEESRRYFEFGSGGSTVWAVKEGLTVYGVESDASWVNALQDKLGEKCQVKAVDIGPTREWGFPVSMKYSDGFTSYSQAIHDHERPFDLVLVDGRFRVACTMAAVLHIFDWHDKPEKARIFIHDFWNRSQYHPVLEFIEPIERSETAGLFKVKPNCDLGRVSQVWHQYAVQPA